MKAYDLEFTKLQEQFEKDCKKFLGGRMDRDTNKIPGIYYQDGEINKFFIAYQLGYSFRDCLARLENQ